MRASTAFLVGIGTVGVAIVGGLGGGLLIADAMNPDPPKHRSEAAQLERRTPDAMSAAAALPYAAATLAFTDSSIDGSARTASQQANANPSSALTRSVTSTPKDTTPKSSQAAPAKQPAQDVQQAPSAMPPSAPEDANAKASDADLKRAAEKRRAERAQRWANRHRREDNQNRYSDTQRSSRDDGEPRSDVGEQPRFAFPRVFGARTIERA